MSQKSIVIIASLGNSQVLVLWQLQMHFVILISKEQSWSCPLRSSMGHSPGHWSCRPRLQKKVNFTSHYNGM